MPIFQLQNCLVCDVFTLVVDVVDFLTLDDIEFVGRESIIVPETRYYASKKVED